MAAVVLVIVGGGGLYYVSAKNDLHRLGERKKALERELYAINTRDEVVSSRIAKLVSFDSLRKRQTTDREAFVRLIAVADTAVVRVPDLGTSQTESQVRAVSNLKPVR
jgi:tRNA A37 N6-isopentenylltransferase MiaA